jgi:hypothetical protein
MKKAATYPGYQRQRIATADLVVGQRIYFPGASMHLPIAQIRREGDETVLIGIYESWGRPRRALVRRKTNGHSTILVPTTAAGKVSIDSDEWDDYASPVPMPGTIG